MQGPAELEGATRDVFLPLRSQPIRFEPGPRGGRRVMPAGDVELAPGWRRCRDRAGVVG